MSYEEVKLYEEEQRKYQGLGKLIREKRIEKGLSIKKLAEIIHTDRSTIQHWEHSRRYPNAYNALQLNLSLNIPLCDICKQRPVKTNNEKIKIIYPNELKSRYKRYLGL